jgi:beta-galactosidase
MDVRYLDRAHALHRALSDQGVGVDFVHPDSDLSGYELVLVPTLYMVSAPVAARIQAAVADGATALVTYFSGIVDENDHIWLGGYPGAFRELLGVRTEEFTPLREHERVRLDNGWTADVWTEHLHLEGAEALATYVDGPVPGAPALTRHSYGAGRAWYSACRLEQGAVDELVVRLLDETGIPRPGAGPGVEVVRRVAADGRAWTFVINHTGTAAGLALRGHDLVSDRTVDGHLRVEAGGVAVVREA